MKNAAVSGVLMLIFLVYSTSAIDLKSPCPEFFSYENNTAVESGKIYGRLKLNSDYELHGVWARLLFDKPSIQLGNTFGQAIANKEHTEYLIKNPQHKLQANSPHEVKIFVKYDPAKGVPQLTQIRLNAKVICPEGAATESPQTTPPATDGEFFLSVDTDKQLA